MAWKNIFVVVVVCLYPSCSAQDTYKAAVVDYAPSWYGQDFPINIIKKNTNKLLELIQQSANEKVDILVFPEGGIVSLDAMVQIPAHMEVFSSVIPDPSEFQPCASDPYKAFIKNISCSARDNKIYVVVNILEKEMGENETQFYNTDLVFDRDGKLVTKYRKISLHDEVYVKPGNAAVTFKTDFGVTFGIFTSYDIMLKTPSLRILENPAVTDIIFTTAWSSLSPFLHALSVQSGYSRGNGVNLLAANLQTSNNFTAGSGIYLANGTSYVHNSKALKLIISNIPKLSKRNEPSNCGQIKAEQFSLDSIDTNNFTNIRENLTNYSFESLNNEGLITEKTVVNGDISCEFKVILKEPLPKTVVYKLVAFNGAKGIPIIKTTIGNSVCGLIACETEDISTCGNGNTANIIFESISLKATLPKLENIFFIPITFTSNNTPTADYDYCFKNKDDSLVINMLTKSLQRGIKSFGIYGRIFAYDGKESGVIGGGSSKTTLIIIIVVSVILIIGLILFALWKFKVIETYSFTKLKRREK